MPPHIRFAARPSVFEIQEPTMDDNLPARSSSHLRRFLSTLSVGSRPGHGLTRTNTMDSSKTTKTERAPIPSMMAPPDEVYATPLPTLSMVVLSIVSLRTVLRLHAFLPCLDDAW